MILLNYNGRADLADCLQSLRASDLSRAHVLVADNGSSDGSVSWLREAHPWVRVLELHRNWGFGKGMNRAVAACAPSPYFALLNNDVEVSPGWLPPLIDALERDPSVAAVQSRIMHYEHRHLIQSAGGGITSHGYGYDQGYCRQVRPPYDAPRDVFFASGGASLFRRKAWEAVGSFDPAFFMYHEDADWGWRAWLAGWRLRYEPGSVVYHKMGATTTKVLGFSARQAMGERHRIRTLLKLAAMPHGLRRIRGGLGFRDWQRARLVLRSVAWNALHLPGTLLARWRSRPARPRQTAEALMHPHARAPELLAWYRPSSAAALRQALDSASFRGVLALRAGSADEVWLGLGWHMAESSSPGGPPVRWMADEAELFAAPPVAAKSVELELLCSPGGPTRGRIQVFQVSTGTRDQPAGGPEAAHEVFELALDAGHSATIRAELPWLQPGTLLRIHWTAETAWPLSPSTGDQRPVSLGWLGYSFRT